MSTAQDLADRYFRIKAKRDKLGTKTGHALQHKMVKIIDRAVELGLADEFSRLLFERCPTPNKYSFRTEKAAKPIFNRTAIPLVPYPCRCGSWHVTTRRKEHHYS